MTENSQDLPSKLMNKDGYRFILDTMPQGCQIIGFDWRYLYVNDAAAKFVRQRKADLLGHTIMERAPGIEATAMFASLQRCMQERKIERTEYEFVYPDGTTAWFELNVQPVPEGILIFSLDITKQKREQESLRRSEERFRFLVDQIEDYAIYLLDPKGYIVSWNFGAEHLKGYQRDEVIGQHYSRFFTTQDQHDNKPQHLLDLVVSQGSIEDEGWRVRKDGSHFWANVVITALRNTDGSLYGFAKITRDLTQRRYAEVSKRSQAEDARRDSEERYRFLFEHMLNGFAYCKMDFDQGRPQDFVYLAVNSAFETLTGLKDVVGKRVTEIIPDIRESDAELFEVYGRVALTGHPQKFETYVASLEKWFSISVYSPQKEYFVAVFDVITERKRAEETLKESEARYRRIVETAYEGIWLIDSESDTTFANRRMAEMLGYTPAEMLHAPLISFMDDESQTIAAAKVERRRQGITEQHDFKFRRKDGSELWAILSTNPIITDDGRYEGSLAMVTDITERRQAEQGLKESEARYRTLIEQASDGIFIANSQGAYIEVNSAGCQMLGYTREEILQKTVRDLTKLDSDHPLRFGELEQGKTLFSEREMIRKDGTLVPVEISAKRLADGSLQGIVRDITEHRRAQESLEQERNLLRTLVDTLPDRIYAKDRDGHFILKNQVDARQMGNASIDEIIGKTDFDYYPAELAEQYSADDEAVMRSGQPLINREEPAVASDGSWGYILTSKVPLRDNQGNVIGLVGIGRDITERRRAETLLQEAHDLLEQRVIERTAELEASKQQVEAILNNSPDGILLVSSELHIRQTNPAFNGLFACQSDEYFDKPLFDLIDEHDAQGIMAVIQTVAAETLAQRVETHALRKDGTSFDAELSVGCIPGGGLVCTIRDITERKRTDEALRQAFAAEKDLGELKSRFVSMASHEFRTPLATILALTETLSAYRHKLSEEQIDLRIGKIIDQVDHLKDIMEDVLLLARMQARRVEYNPVMLDLDELCRNVLEEFQSRPEVTHHLDYLCKTPIRVVSLDKKLMRQVISNLVSNAIKYSPKDKPIEVSLEFTSDSLILSVSDEGIGIPEADLQHLFEPFHRAINVGAISGTGLGLVITKESVELHHGTITVDSRVGIGTTFTITMPITAEGILINDKNLGK